MACRCEGNTWTPFTLATRTDTGPTNGTPVSDRTKFGPLARFKLKYYTSNSSYLARATVTALVVIHYHV